MGVIGAGAGTITSGQRTLAAIGATRKKPQFTGEFINISGDVAPLYLLIKKLGKSKTVHQASYFHLETDWLPTEVTSDGGLADEAGPSTLTVHAGDANTLTIGTILKCNRTGELMRVTATPSSTTATVTRSFGTSGHPAVNNDEALVILSFADTEGNTSPAGLSSEPLAPSNFTNYCQTFRQALELSGRDMESDNFGPGELERIKKDALEAITQKVEKAFLFQNVGNATDPTMTKGAEGWISTNVVDVGGALSESVLIDSIITPWFRRNNSKKTMMGFAGEKFFRALDAFGRDNIRYAPSDTGIGIAVMKYRTNFGEIEMVRHGLMTPVGNSVTSANYGWQGYFIGLNMELVGKRVFGDRELQLLKDRQTPDKDGIKWEYLTDEGFYLGSELQHVLAKGITG